MTTKEEAFNGNNPLEHFTRKYSEVPKKHETKRRVGRPATKHVKETCRKINVAVPIELLDKWDEVKKALGGNQTAYIVNLIRKDLNENYESYKELAKKQEELGL